MSYTDTIGYIATLFILSSFLCKEMFSLRVCNTIGGILWIFYGLTIHSAPTYLLNSCILCIHAVWFYKYFKSIN